MIKFTKSISVGTLQNFSVVVGDAVNEGDLCHHYIGESIHGSQEIACTQTARGKYVTIKQLNGGKTADDILQLCEVEVFLQGQSQLNSVPQMQINNNDVKSKKYNPDGTTYIFTISIMPSCNSFVYYCNLF